MSHFTNGVINGGIMKKVTMVILLGIILYFTNIRCEDDQNSQNKVGIMPWYDNFVKLCMDIWTTIDLIRSVNATQQQKEQFSCEIAHDILLVYKVTDFEKHKMPNNYDCEQLAQLVKSIKESFEAVFKQSKSTGFIVGSFLLNKIIVALEAQNPVKYHSAC